MGGPYKMCQSCNGPGTRCRRCPLEDDVETTDDEGGEVKALSITKPYWGPNGRCIYCGAGNDAHHSYACPTDMHPDKRADQ
jgi:hypothetical protein